MTLSGFYKYLRYNSVVILSPPVPQWPRRRAGFTFYCSSADENGECSRCMQAKRCYHNGMVILKAPPQFLDHYQGGEPGQQPIKWTYCLSFWKEVKQNRLFATLVVLLRLMVGGTPQCSVSQSYLRRLKILKKIFPLPPNQIWSISTYNQGTFEIPDKIHLSPCIMLSFILHGIISMNM